MLWITTWSVGGCWSAAAAAWLQEVGEAGGEDGGLTASHCCYRCCTTSHIINKLSHFRDLLITVNVLVARIPEFFAEWRCEGNCWAVAAAGFGWNISNISNIKLTH